VLAICIIKVYTFHIGSVCFVFMVYFPVYDICIASCWQTGSSTYQTNRHQQTKLINCFY